MANVTSRTEQGMIVISLSGRFSNPDLVSDFEAELKSLGDNRQSAVIDLSEVTYINSIGLGLLADAVALAREHGGNIVLSGMTPPVNRVFRITGIDRFLDIRETREEALAALLS